VIESPARADDALEHRWRQRPVLVLVTTALVVTVGWLLVVLIWHPAPMAMTFDDAFYYFGIARNVAHGHGSTFDGINLTNGYHPLWMLLSVPVFALGGDGTPAVRVLLGFQVLCFGGALVVVAVVVARAIGGWPRLRAARPAGDAAWCTGLVAAALALVGANPYVVKVIVNGMESGVLVLIDALILAVGASRRGRLLAGDRLGQFALGGLLALAVLARTDTVLLLAILGIWALAEARPRGRRAIGPLLAIFGLPAVTLVAYLISNEVLFGELLQISGVVKHAPLTAERLLWAIVVGGGAALVAFWGFRQRGRKGPAVGRFRRTRAFAASTAWFAAFCIVVVAYYQLFQTQQWLWYYCPLALYAVFLLTLGVADFAEAAVLEAPKERKAGRALLPVALILLLPLVAGLVLETRTFAQPSDHAIATADRQAGEWINRHLPKDTVLASWDAGALGFYAHRPVMNLDGVANSRAFYDASRAGRLGQFLTERGIDGIVNVGTPVDGEDPEITSYVRGVLGNDAAATLHLVRAFPFTYTGSTEGGAGGRSGTQHLAIFLYSLSP
jgi:hypothetical protein